MRNTTKYKAINYNKYETNKVLGYRRETALQGCRMRYSFRQTRRLELHGRQYYTDSIGLSSTTVTE